MDIESEQTKKNDSTIDDLAEEEDPRSGCCKVMICCGASISAVALIACIICIILIIVMIIYISVSLSDGAGWNTNIGN